MTHANIDTFFLLSFIGELHFSVASQPHGVNEIDYCIL